MRGNVMIKLGKKVTFLGIILFLVAIFSIWTICDAYAQEWHIANQITISWDAVTKMEGGAIIPETDIIEYKVHLANAIIDPEKTNSVEIGIADECIYTLTLNTEGQYFVGLQTLRMKPDRTLIAESVIGWSDDPAIVANGAIFGLQYFVPPLPPHNVRVVSGG